MNNICDSCGFGLWRYNHDTLTCKHGHLWTETGQAVGEHAPAPATAAAPMVPFVAPEAARSYGNLPLIGCCLLLAADVITRLVGA